MQQVLAQYGFTGDVALNSISSGLINHTWLIDTGTSCFVLQRINQQVFNNPQAIAHNIRQLGNYLRQQHPDYIFTHPVPTIDGQDMAEIAGEQYRLFVYVNGSHTIDVVATPEQAYEAARQFGCFTNRLAGFDTTQLQTTLPNFHNLPLRFEQFSNAIQQADESRLAEARLVVDFLLAQKNIVQQYNAVVQTLPRWVIHHDTKISNVLFDKNDKGICVIDLDTVMPGYCTSDMGDMLRTYLCPVSEEEADYQQIHIRPLFYKAVLEGYAAGLDNLFAPAIQANFHFAGLQMVYMQALRFVTDYLQNDAYYGAKYEGHNFIRAGNQVALLRALQQYQP